MRLPLFTALAGVATIGLVACEPAKPPEPECGVTNRTLADTQWVMWRPCPAGRTGRTPAPG